MTRRMLINARNPLELRVAVTSDKTLDDLKIDVAERGLTRGNIYFGKISNIQPSLNAAFIDYGAERNGFLTIQDVVADAYYRDPKKGQRPRIEDVLEEGRPIVVQITREPEGQKGAALTTNLSLAGRYLVLTPFDSTRGVSRKVDDDTTRRELKKIASGLKVPDNGGFIVRTNALGQNKTTLNRDLNALLRLWKRISTEARRSKERGLLYSDQDIVLQALRDYLDPSVEEVLVDEDSAFKKAQEYIRAFMPRSRTKLTYYEDPAPLFSRYGLEEQIDRIYQRSAPLPSGGSIVIDPTEALTAIDVNSGRSTRASSQEDTALNTNMEAAVEVARQLRLRDIGGLIVVDFIDMRSRKNQRQVEKVLNDALKPDKARSTISRISANGLVEINRQRIQQAIQMRTHRICPTCAGTGRVPSPELQALHILRELQARCSDGSIERVRINLHPEMADALQNNQRLELSRIEAEFDVRVEVHSSLKLGRSERDIDWFARAMLRRSAITRRAPAAGLTSAAEDSRTERMRPSRRNRSDGDPGPAAKGRRHQSDSDGDEKKTVEAEAEDLQADREEGSQERKKTRSRRRSSRGGRGRRRSASDRPEADATASDKDDAESSASARADDADGAASRAEGNEESRSSRSRSKSRPRGRRRPPRGAAREDGAARDGAARDSDSRSEQTASEASETGERTRPARTSDNGDGDNGREARRPRRRRPRRRRAGADGDAGDSKSTASESTSEGADPQRTTRDQGSDKGDNDRPRPRRTRTRKARPQRDSDSKDSDGNGSAPKPALEPLPDYVPRPGRTWSRAPKSESEPDGGSND